MKTGQCTFDNAKRIHFLHNNKPDQSYDNTTGRIVEWYKDPLEAPVFLNYEGQGSAGFPGTQNQPNKIARVLDNGNTQFTQLSYNGQGNPTSYTDPAGRKTKLDYDGTGYRVTAVKQETPSGDVTLKTIDYDVNGLPEEITDASGQTYIVTYNGFGQPTMITNPLSQTRTLDYSTTGLLIREIANDLASYAEYAYDSYDRVTSVTYFPDAYALLPKS